MIQLMNIEYYHYHDNEDEDEDIRVKDFFDDTHGLVKSLEINDDTLFIGFNFLMIWDWTITAVSSFKHRYFGSD